MTQEQENAVPQSSAGFRRSITHSLWVIALSWLIVAEVIGSIALVRLIWRASALLAD